MKKIMVYSIKGGTGKTTQAKTLSKGFAMRGKRVLEIDLDPQGNSTKSFTQVPNDIKRLTEAISELNSAYSKEKELLFIKQYSKQQTGVCLSDVFDDPKKIIEAIRSTRFNHLDVLPSNLELSQTDTKLRLETMKRQENRLRKALNHVRDCYDLVVMDCSPAKSLLTVNALMTEPLVLIPVDFSDDSLQGIALTLQEINALREEYDEIADIDYRILLTLKNSRMRSHQNTESLVRAFFGEKVLNTTIRFQESPINEANEKGLTVLDIKKSNIAEDYEMLLSELEEIL